MLYALPPPLDGARVDKLNFQGQNQLELVLTILNK